ncbi:hypothetical protein LZ31DRAFT_560682 [Colletotrichum somersetense]|nr:hypothetical protein LZ31DRAFT_560682 [Colletotrichum somersetense]
MAGLFLPFCSFVVACFTLLLLDISLRFQVYRCYAKVNRRDDWQHLSSTVEQGYLRSQGAA